MPRLNLILAILVSAIAAKAGALAGEAQEEPPQTDLRIFRLAYIISPEKKNEALSNESLFDVLKKMNGPKGSITFEKRSKAFVVRDTAANLDEMQTIIDEFDQPSHTDDLFGPLTAERHAKAALFSFDVTERPLKQVLDYLSEAGKRIAAVKERHNRLLVTLSLKNVTPRAALAVLALKYGITAHDSKDGEIVVDTPPTISLVFKNADFRDVIQTIMIQSDVEITIDPGIDVGAITGSFERVRCEDALNAVLRRLNLIAVKRADNSIRIAKPVPIPITDAMRKAAEPAITAYLNKMSLVQAIKVNERLSGAMMARNFGDRRLRALELTLSVPIEGHAKPIEHRFVYTDSSSSVHPPEPGKNEPALLQRVDLPLPEGAKARGSLEMRITYLEFAE